MPARSRSATPGWTGSSTSCIDPRFLRPAEVDLLVGNAGQGRAGARLDAERDVRADDGDDGRRRPRAALSLTGSRPAPSAPRRSGSARPRSTIRSRRGRRQRCGSSSQRASGSSTRGQDELRRETGRRRRGGRRAARGCRASRSARRPPPPASPTGTVTPAPAAAARSPTTSPADDTTGTRPHSRSIEPRAVRQLGLEAAMVQADRAIGLGVPGDALVVRAPRAPRRTRSAIPSSLRGGERLEQAGIRRVRAWMAPADDHEPGVRDALERAREPAHRRGAVEPRIHAAVPEHERSVFGHEHAAADPSLHGAGWRGRHAERHLEQRRIVVGRRIQRARPPRGARACRAAAACSRRGRGRRASGARRCARGSPGTCPDRRSARSPR